MAEAPLPSPDFVSACVRVGDYEVTYLSAGPEPQPGEPEPETVLLLHGFGAWSEVVWSRTIPALASRYRVLAPDLLGFGLTSKPANDVFVGGDPFEAHVSFLAEFLDALGVKRAAVVGSSFGGGLALRLATLMPERVTRLALVGSMGLGRSIHPVYKALAAPLLGPRIVRPDRERLRRMWSWIVHKPDEVPDEVIERNFELLSEPGAVEVLVAARHGVNLIGQRIVFSGELTLLRQPTLLVWGKQDRIFPVRHAHRAARLIPDSDLVVLDGVGHLPPFEAPDAFNDAILRFLARPARLQDDADVPTVRAAPAGDGEAASV